LLAETRDDPTAVIENGRTIQAASESGQRPGDQIAKRNNGSMVHIGVDMLAILLRVSTVSADKLECKQGERLIIRIREVVGNANTE